MRVVLILLLMTIWNGVNAKSIFCGTLSNDSIVVTQDEHSEGKEISIKFPSVIEEHRFIGASVKYGSNQEFDVEIVTWETEELIHEAFVTVKMPHEQIHFSASYTLGACHRSVTIKVNSSA